jgi:hypothetical protein
MIVLSPNLVLAPPAPGGFNANAPIIGWDNRVTLSGVSATSEDVGHPASNLANPSTAERWQSVSLDAQYLTFEVSALQEPVEYVGIARHNFGSGSVAIQVEAEQIDALNTWDVLQPERILADDGPLVFQFEPVLTRRIRLRLGPTGVLPRAAVVYVGRLMRLQRNIYVGHTPLPMARASNVQTNRAESGDFLGRVVLQESLSNGFTLQNLTPAWVRTILMPFLKQAQERPFFFGWRPSDYPDEVGYAWLTNDPQPSNQRPNGMMQVELQLGGVAL